MALLTPYPACEAEAPSQYSWRLLLFLNQTHDNWTSQLKFE